MAERVTGDFSAVRRSAAAQTGHGNVPSQSWIEQGEESSREVAEGEADRPHTLRLPLEEVHTKKEISIVFTGRSGAGKSTLISNMFDIEMKGGKLVSPKSITKNHYTVVTTENDVTLMITDTIGLQQGKEKDCLKKLAKHMQEQGKGRTDILVYCLPVNPSSKFELQNIDIMQSLQDAFGRDIWKQVLVVFTFSNAAWDRFKKKGKTKSKAEVISQYVEHIQLYGKLFEEQLKKMKVPNVSVDTKINNLPREPPPENQTTIPAIPAGDDPEDEVLLYVEQKNIMLINPTAGRLRQVRDWRDVLFTEMVKKCADAAQLRYRYGLPKIPTVAAAMAGGAALGGTVMLRVGPEATGLGAATGALIGGAMALTQLKLE